MIPTISILFFSLLFSFIFSSVEFIYFLNHKLQIEVDLKQTTFLTRFSAQLSNVPSYFMASLSIGSQLSLLVFIVLVFKLSFPFFLLHLKFKLLAFIIEIIIISFTFLIIGHLLPSVFFRQSNKRLFQFLQLPISIFNFIFTPFSVSLILMSKFILYVFFKLEFKSEKSEKIYIQIALENFLNYRNSEHNNTQDIQNDVKLMQNALEFANVKLRDFLVPRTEIIAIEINRPIEDLYQKFIDFGFSKILVYKDSIDNIIGYVHSLILFSNPIDIQSCLLPVTIVPETMPADKMLRLFTTQKKGIALVVDEFGGTAGIVTIEDVMEQIFGEIEDEHDTIEMIEKKVNANEFVFSARLEIEYLNNKYNLELPESDDYNTLAGLILAENEDMPKLQQEIKIDAFQFKILKASSTKIELIRMKCFEE